MNFTKITPNIPAMVFENNSSGIGGYISGFCGDRKGYYVIPDKPKLESVLRGYSLRKFISQFR